MGDPLTDSGLCPSGTTRLPPAPRPRGLYVHVPFCVRTCPYCDFYKLAPRSPRDPSDYLDALEREAAHKLPPDETYATIYVGGGTPSELPAPELERLLRLLAPLASGGAEFTFEANPGTLGKGNLSRMKDGGVTRISLGAQTFDDELLRKLGRVHDSRDTREAVALVREAGIPDLNLDLIFAVPGQTRPQLERDVREVVALAPDHVSAYCLTYEPGTPFGSAVTAGKLRPAPEEHEADLMECVREGLGAAGLVPYEISNFARPGHHSRHNLDTWHYARYRALGPSAASFVGYTRTTNARDLDRWSRGEIEEEERIDARTALGEVLLLGLRLDSGISRAEVFARAGSDLDEVRGSELERLGRRGLVDDDGQTIRLTPRGRLLANQVIVELL